MIGWYQEHAGECTTCTCCALPAFLLASLLACLLACLLASLLPCFLASLLPCFLPSCLLASFLLPCLLPSPFCPSFFQNRSNSFKKSAPFPPNILAEAAAVAVPATGQHKRSLYRAWQGSWFESTLTCGYIEPEAGGEYQPKWVKSEAVSAWTFHLLAFSIRVEHTRMTKNFNTMTHKTSKATLMELHQHFLTSYSRVGGMWLESGGCCVVTGRSESLRGCEIEYA